MDNIKNTFIPHESNSPKKDTFGIIVVVISIAALIVSVLFAGFSYISRTTYAKKLASYEESLKNSKERFNQGLPIRTIEQFDTRLRSAKDLLAKHKSFQSLFDLVERITLKNVQLKSFTYTDSSNLKKNTVHLVGLAPDYKTIAEQSEQFSIDTEARRYITDVVFSNLSVDEKNSGLISFEVEFTVDSEFLSYARSIENESGITSTPSLRENLVPNIVSQ